MAKLVEDDYNGWTARRLSIAFSGQNVPMRKGSFALTLACEAAW
jgi:hypothetical protein